MVLISDTTVFEASSFKTMRVFVPYTEFPRIEATQLQLARHKLAQNVTTHWDGNYKGGICSSMVVIESYGNLTANVVFEIKNEYHKFKQYYQLSRDRMSLFCNYSNMAQEEKWQKKIS